MAPPLPLNTATGHPMMQSSSQRATAVFLASVVAIALSPLYMDWGSDRRRSRFHESSMMGSGFVLPMVLAALIVAIKATYWSAVGTPSGPPLLLSREPSWVLRIGGSPWGLAGVLVMLMLVLSCQDSAQHFLWK